MNNCTPGTYKGGGETSRKPWKWNRSWSSVPLALTRVREKAIKLGYILKILPLALTRHIKWSPPLVSCEPVFHFHYQIAATANDVHGHHILYSTEHVRGNHCWIFLHDGKNSNVIYIADYTNITQETCIFHPQRHLCNINILTSLYHIFANQMWH